MAVHMGLLVVSGLFGPCKINVYKKNRKSAESNLMNRAMNQKRGDLNLERCIESKK